MRCPFCHHCHLTGFFVNNQFRLIVDGTPAGSDNLEEVFEANLRRTGRVVAILDTWHQPMYLRRVWIGDFFSRFYSFLPFCWF